MLTDEQLITEIRRELDHELSHLSPPAGLVERAWDQARPDTVRRRRRLPLRAGTGAVIVSAVLVAVIAVGAVVLLSRHEASVAPPQRLAIPPDATSRRAMISILAVLRRPQTPSDRNPGPLNQLNRGFPTGSPIKSLERLAAVTRSGARIYLVPINKPTNAQIRHYLSNLTPKRVRPTMRRQLEALARHEPTFRGLVLVTNGGAGACRDAAAIVTGQCFVSSGGSAGHFATVVVPDGVAQVSITIRSRQQHSITLTEAVRANVASFYTRRPVTGLDLEHMVWRRRSGAVIARP